MEAPSSIPFSGGQTLPLGRLLGKSKIFRTMGVIARIASYSSAILALEVMNLNEMSARTYAITAL